MKKYKALKMRIYPNDAQSKMIKQTIGSCRYIHNHMLSRNIKAHQRRGEHLSYYDMQYLLRGMKEYLTWLKDADSQALMYACREVDSAFQNFFQKKTGYPKFKSKHSGKQSYTTTQIVCIAYDPCTRMVKLPKLGWIPCSERRVLKDGCKFKRATVSCKNGKYYASLMYEYEEDIAPVTITDESQVCGLDYKSNGLYVSDIGACPDMHHFYREAYNKLKHEQRKLSHMIESHVTGYKVVFGKKVPMYDKPLSECRNIQKQMAVVNKIHEQISNQRKDWLHHKSLELADTYDAICVEDLDMKALSNKGFGNGKATLDNGYGMFLYFLAYKLEDRGKKLIKVGKFYPSSQTCSVCGTLNPQVKDLSVRRWICPHCGAEHDRDVNAAINIKREGLRILGIV